MKNVKVWPHLTLLALACALVGGVVAALWMRNEPKAEALTVARAARLERVDGEVGLDRSLDTVGDEMLWEAEPNTPLTEGDRIYAGDSSSAGLAFTGRNYARLDPDTALDVLSLSDRRTQLALRSGSAVFDLGELEDGELYEVATPHGAVELREPGLYHLGMNDDGSAFVSVLNGLAQVVGLAGSGEIGKGEMLTLLGQTAAQIALSRLNPEYAGGLLDDYYGYRYPDAYDGRYADYNAYLQDPAYYDPYQGYQSYRYVPQSVPGAWELDRYGDWVEVGDYGHAWRPRVEDGWAPYQQGSWMLDEPYGLTWVSSEPWGYAPYHYGRWANVGGQWYWVPGGADAAPSYAPALVAFMPVEQANQIAWVPLAPGDPYSVPHYDEQWRPHYYNGESAAPESVVNFGVPGALTVVPAEFFGRDIDRGVIVRGEPRDFERQRPVVEPLSHAMLRQLSLTRANERRGFSLPPGLAKRLEETRVYASEQPRGARGRGDASRAPRVEALPERQKREKLKFRDERREEVAGRPAAPPPAAAARVARGRAAREASEPRGRGQERREARRAERQQMVVAPPQAAPRQDVPRAMGERRGRGAEGERRGRGAEQRPQGERVGMRQQQAPQVMRPQHQPRPQRERQQAGPPPQARPQRVEQPRPERGRGGPPAHAGGGGGGGRQQKQQSPGGGGGGKGKGKGRP